jgi:hypothetical protein
LAQHTVELLHAFAAAGGPVLALEPVPVLVAGRSKDGPVLPKTAQIVTLDELSDTLDDHLPFDIRVAGRPEIWAHHRRIGDVDGYFLANTDLENGGVAAVTLRGTGQLESWDPATGEICALPCYGRDGLTEVELDFAPAGSYLLMLHRDRAPIEGAAVVERAVGQFILGDMWKLDLSGPNALTLDTARVRIGTGAWSKPMHILDAHGHVARAGVGTPFSLRFVCSVDVQPPGPLYLVLESPERFDVAVNGQSISNADAGWWVDISFRKLDVSSVVQAGRNEIVLSGVGTRDTELESIYLIGHFGVSGIRLRGEGRYNGQIFDRYASVFRVTDLPNVVRAGRDAEGLPVDLTASGLPFFAGRVRLRQTVMLPGFEGRAVLEVDDLRAAVAHVWVNGQSMGTVAWPPHRVDITAGVRVGENVIEVELVNTLRNLLGPHHHIGGDRGRTGPRDFRDKSAWTDDLILVPFGFDKVMVGLFK